MITYLSDDRYEIYFEDTCSQFNKNQEIKIDKKNKITIEYEENEIIINNDFFTLNVALHICFCIKENEYLNKEEIIITLNDKEIKNIILKEDIKEKNKIKISIKNKDDMEYIKKIKIWIESPFYEEMSLY